MAEVRIVKLLGSPVEIVPNIKGTYSGTTGYNYGDQVFYNGSSYIAIATTTGNLPTNATYWQEVAAQGSTGATGATGATGPTGATGAGVPVGGTTNQILAKNSNTDYDTKWEAAPSGTLAGLTDASITSPADNDVLTYVAAASKWENKPASGGGGSVTPGFTFATDFSNASRYTTGGAGTVTIGTNGATVARSGSTDFTYIADLSQTLANHKPFDKNPRFWVGVEYGSASYPWAVIFGMGRMYSGGLTTSNQLGFRIENNYGTPLIYGVTADGTTRHEVSLTPPASIGVTAATFLAVMTSGTKVDFYIDGSLAGTSTSNLPTGYSTEGWAWLCGVFGEGGSTTAGATPFQNLGYTIDY